jgi:hypothetical protein
MNKFSLSSCIPALVQLYYRILLHPLPGSKLLPSFRLEQIRDPRNMPQMNATGYQLSAISYQLSAISSQPLLAENNDRSPIIH